MARTGMQTLIDTVRGFANAAPDEWEVTSDSSIVTYWSDDEIQRVLDRHKVEHTKTETEHYYWPGFSGYQFQVHPAALAECMEAAYLSRRSRDMKEAARAGALAYDADVVTERYWRPALEDMAEHLESEVDFEAMAGLR